MRFLVMSRPKHPIPPEMTMALLDKMQAWVNETQSSGKMETIWAWAAGGGGGGIVNVASHEELNALMSRFPFLPFSDTEAIPIADLSTALENFKQAFQAMMPPGGGR